MVKSRSNGTSKSLTEMFRFLMCCFSIQKLTVKSLRGKRFEKDGQINISGNAVSFNEELSGSCCTDDAPQHKQDYPEHLNPFANETDADFLIGNQEMRKPTTVSDYPEHLNPFSDDDDGGD